MLDSRHVNDWLLTIRSGGLTCTCWSFVATCANDAITDLSSSSSSLSSCLKFSIIRKNRSVSCVVRSDSLRFLAIVLRLSSVVSVVTKKGGKELEAVEWLLHSQAHPQQITWLFVALFLASSSQPQVPQPQQSQRSTYKCKPPGVSLFLCFTYFLI